MKKYWHLRFFATMPSSSAAKDKIILALDDLPVETPEGLPRMRYSTVVQAADPDEAFAIVSAKYYAVHVYRCWPTKTG